MSRAYSNAEQLNASQAREGVPCGSMPISCSRFTSSHTRGHCHGLTVDDVRREPARL